MVKVRKTVDRATHNFGKGKVKNVVIQLTIMVKVR